MDKLQNFRRINEPRVRRALEQIAHVRNSAKSMRLVEEGEELLTQIGSVVKIATTGGGPVAIPRPTPEPLPEPGGVAIDQRHEIRWAFDCIRRGQYDIAEDRIKRVLDAWNEEE